ncbi:MAG: NusG domain II-containing protein [Defluviitaleaceae bacterium]|nr:NusG domain II-containing protein [Defluviitaleaceae bacterium]
MARKLISKNELLLIAVILLLAFGAYMIITWSSDDAVYARISVRNYPVVYLNLSENTEFTLPQNPNVRFKVENGAVAFIASDCPDQVCVRLGFLHRVGQSGACLPNWVSLVIIGAIDDEDMDILS